MPRRSTSSAHRLEFGAGQRVGRPEPMLPRDRRAVAAWSPVIILTRMPALGRPDTAVVASGDAAGRTPEADEPRSVGTSSTSCQCDAGRLRARTFARRRQDPRPCRAQLVDLRRPECAIELIADRSRPSPRRYGRAGGPARPERARRRRPSGVEVSVAMNGCARSSKGTTAIRGWRCRSSPAWATPSTRSAPSVGLADEAPVPVLLDRPGVVADGHRLDERGEVGVGVQRRGGAADVDPAVGSIAGPDDVVGAHSGDDGARRHLVLGQRPRLVRADHA